MNTEDVAKKLLDDYGEDVGDFILKALKNVQDDIGLTLAEARYYLESVDWFKFLCESIKEDVKLGRSLNGMFQESLDLLEKITKFE